MMPLPLPTTFSPDDLEATAELAAIVERLQPRASAAGTTGGHDGSNVGASGAAGAAGVAGVAAGGAAAGGTPAAAGGPGADGAGGLRDLPTATDSLRHKLQHARTQIRALPDVGRTVAEQEAEMRALEARLQKQQAVLAQLREEGARFAEGEQQQQQQQ